MLRDSSEELVCLWGSAERQLLFQQQLIVRTVAKELLQRLTMEQLCTRELGTGGGDLRVWNVYGMCRVVRCVLS